MPGKPRSQALSPLPPQRRESLGMKLDVVPFHEKNVDLSYAEAVRLFVSGDTHFAQRNYISNVRISAEERER